MASGNLYLNVKVCQDMLGKKVGSFVISIYFLFTQTVLRVSLSQPHKLLSYITHVNKTKSAAKKFKTGPVKKV